MDVRPGGAWRFVHRDSNGDETGFRGTYREVTPPERIIQTFEWEGMPGYVIVETATFEDLGGRTKVTATSLFHTTESGMEKGVDRVPRPPRRAPGAVVGLGWPGGSGVGLRRGGELDTGAPLASGPTSSRPASRRRRRTRSRTRRRRSPPTPPARARASSGRARGRARLPALRAGFATREPARAAPAGVRSAGRGRRRASRAP
ncbi:MAG: SRPBCC domain-containing protein [Thermoleophilaceae bacterium]|nr:SRPBCC domain-containing protein [Thermoleophilaceae bacterium]